MFYRFLPRNKSNETWIFSRNWECSQTSITIFRTLDDLKFFGIGFPKARFLKLIWTLIFNSLILFCSNFRLKTKRTVTSYFLLARLESDTKWNIGNLQAKYEERVINYFTTHLRHCEGAIHYYMWMNPLHMSKIRWEIDGLVPVWSRIVYPQSFPNESWSIVNYGAGENVVELSRVLLWSMESMRFLFFQSLASQTMNHLKVPEFKNLFCIRSLRLNVKKITH